VTVSPTKTHRSVDGPGVAPSSRARGERTSQVAGPFLHGPGDDDSSAVTFWGKSDLREVLRLALRLLDAHYGGKK
jgi:hypothetical protein